MKKALLLVILAACGTSSSGGPPDPAGAWQLSLNPGAGTCGFQSAQAVTLYVDPAGSGYTVSDADGTTVASSSVTCGGESCSMQLHETSTSGVDITYTLTLRGTTISGSGSFTAANCSQAFSVTGSRD